MEDDQQEVILKISGSKDAGYAKKVAGAMTWRLREVGFCKARAVKQDAVNSAIKALAICNERVAEAGMSFCVDLTFSEAINTEGKTATAIEMIIQEADPERPEVFLDFKVSGKSEQDKNVVKNLAEAVAGRVREGKGIKMKCIGPAAVYRAIMASTIARGLIFPNGYDCVIVPKWDTIERENAPPISFLNIAFWGKKKS